MISEKDAIKGFDGRPLFFDTVTIRLLRLMLPSSKEEMLKPLQTSYSNTFYCFERDFTEGNSIKFAIFSLSDCVVTSEIGLDTASGKVVIIERQMAKINGILPETVCTRLVGRDLSDVVDSKLFKGCKIYDTEIEEGTTIINFDRGNSWHMKNL